MQDWTVQPHSALNAVADHLWTVDGVIQMPPGPLPRRMTIVRLANGDLIVFSAIALDEAGMAAVEALGRPAFLVIPNGFHRQDARGWKNRYPKMRVVGAEGARAAVEEVVPLYDTTGAFGDGRPTFVAVAGTIGEAALVVTTGGQTTLVINDLIGNVQDARGLMKLVLRIMGFGGSGKPQVPRMFKARAVQDAAAVAAQFRRWADIADLRRIIVSHGAIIEQDPAGLLRRLAAGLSKG